MSGLTLSEAMPILQSVAKLYGLKLYKPIFIEAPTVYFSQTLLGKENISIF
jgi:hypothetical protein